MKKYSRYRRQASSLVITLLVVTVLTIIVVAFLQSMTLERKTAGSYSNILKARLAAEASLEQAIARIQSTLPTNSANWTNGFVVWSWGKDTNFNTTYTGILTNIFSTNDVVPNQLGVVTNTVWLFSCSNSTVAPDLLQTSISSNYFNVNANNRINASTNIIPVDWVVLTNVTNGAAVDTIRTAYWVSDEAGRLPATAIGNTANASTYDGKMEDLQVAGLNAGEVSALVAGRPSMASLRGQSYLEVVRSLSNSPTSLGFVSTNVTGRILYGAYALQKKVNLNTLFTNSASPAAFVESFNGIVSNAIPFYFARKEGVPGTTKRIAASVYDYMDTNDAPTFSPNLASYFANYQTAISPWPPANDYSTYYGVDSAPKLNEFLVYYGTASSATNQYQLTPTNITLGVTRIFELWNMGQAAKTLTNVSVRFFGHQTVSIFGGDDLPPTEETIVFTNSVNIPANGFATLIQTTNYVSPQSGSTLTNFDDYRGLIPKVGSVGVIIAASFVNGASISAPAVIDAVYPLELQNTPASGKAGDTPGYSGSAELADTRANIGQYLGKWANITGTSHTPGAANNMSAGSYQDMRGWFDQPQMGAVNGVSPTTPPMYVKNQAMEFAGELGDIWDPSPDITDTSGLAQGGKTLVIGQFDPYYRLQNVSDLAVNRNYIGYLRRADAALLDVFTANDGPRFNINSPRPRSEPSRPLAWITNAFQINKDVFPQATKPSFNGTNFENVVIARLATASWKSARPFRNMNDLVLLGTTLTGVPGAAGTNFWGTNSASATIWNTSGAPTNVSLQITASHFAAAPTTVTLPSGDDHSREEAFRRIANFVDFGSLSFRIYAAGQVLNKSGKVAARSNIQAIVTFVPSVSTNSDGTTAAVSYTPKIEMQPVE